MKKRRKSPRSPQRKKKPTLRDTQNSLAVLLRNVRGFNGVGIGLNGSLAVRARDEASSKRLLEKIGGTTFRGVNVNVEVTGEITALATAAGA